MRNLFWPSEGAWAALESLVRRHHTARDRLNNSTQNRENDKPVEHGLFAYGFLIRREFGVVGAVAMVRGRRTM